MFFHFYEQAVLSTQVEGTTFSAHNTLYVFTSIESVKILMKSTTFSPFYSFTHIFSRQAVIFGKKINDLARLLPNVALVH